MTTAGDATTTTPRRRAPATIYGSADVASALGVGRQAFSNYLANRYGTDGDTPPPRYVTPDGRKFWDTAGVKAWHRWRASWSK